MSLGFKGTRQSHLRFDILAGIDVDRHALASYAANVRAQAVEADIREIAADPSALEHSIDGLDAADDTPLVFIGCPPCQGFSAHRKKDPRIDPRNDLVTAFTQICKHWIPDAIVIENVPEVIQGRHAYHFETALEALKCSGYHIDAGVLDFSQYGLPQRRRRAVVVAARQAIALPTPPTGFDGRGAVTVRDAIGHLPPVDSGQVDPADPWHKAPNHITRILRRIRETPVDGGDRRDLSRDQQLDCHNSVDGGSTPGFTDVYGRLRWDRPSVTITAKSSTPSCGRFLHPDQHRNITVREAAILQGFPQDFEFEGPFVNQFRQIGEAVPPLIARFLANALLDHFRPLPYSGRRPECEPEGGMLMVDAFCGAGGMSLGFEQAGFDPALAFDNDKDSVATYRANYSGGHALCGDATDSATAEAVSAAVTDQEWILVGGPPCQGFSQQRRGADLDDRNHLVLELPRLAAVSSNPPRAVVLENVTYLDSPRGRRILAKYIALMERLGFRTFRHDLNSAEFGVPQLRKRIFVVSLTQNAATRYTGPQPLTPNRWMTVGEALDGLPEADLHEESSPPNHYSSNESGINRRRIGFVDMGRGRMSIPADLQLDCHRKYGGHLDVYGRLDWFGYARTITGGFDSFTRGEYAHPFRHRSLTPREAARLQGFPDEFTFTGNRASVRRQIGNAVPPPLAFAIGVAVADALVGVAGARRAA